MLKVVVDRQRWLRGEGSSYLLRPNDGKMCCLGFACLAAGLSEDEIKGWTTPNHVCVSLMETNDTSSISDAEREARLIDLGLEAGIEFSFEN